MTFRTATYKYPEFTFTPSTAPESLFWRNIIPYETSFDFMDGDVVFYWQQPGILTASMQACAWVWDSPAVCSIPMRMKYAKITASWISRGLKKQPFSRGGASRRPSTITGPILKTTTRQASAWMCMSIY